ncbi:PEP-CTERM sorting domain-containing protein [Massilia sp. MB5]|uniref:PEP-CTERM sorting domain-containing protein n=1 Tax=Massilia sp. MB5 TaxID=2919578 RepID=UPI001F0FCB3E|nr:PEP-CTERM sorting domain-containing protein [Massilia sp. MB5]UMR32676.1 PEP-CTERM sorting domain-containing protein [Massilia sp. MB5]
MKTLLTSALIGIMIALPAKADILTYSFTAKIDTLIEQSGTINPISVSSGVVSGETISLGNSVKGSFTYDTTTRLSSWQPEQPSGAVYVIYSDLRAANAVNFSFDQNNLRFNSNGSWSLPKIWLTNSNYDSLAYWDSAYQDSKITHLRLHFVGNGDIFPGNALPATIPLDKLLFSSFTYEVSDYSGATPWSLYAHGKFSSIELTSTTPVPEPGMYLMLLAGLAGMGLVARCRQMHR